MSRKPYDDLPWWSKLMWRWFGPPWYEQVEDPGAYLAAYWCALHLSAADWLSCSLAMTRQVRANRPRQDAGHRPPPSPGEHQPRVRPPTREDEDDGDEPAPDGNGRWSWTATTRPGREVDAEQQERIGDPAR